MVLFKGLKNCGIILPRNIHEEERKRNGEDFVYKSKQALVEFHCSIPPALVVADL